MPNDRLLDLANTADVISRRIPGPGCEPNLRDLAKDVRDLAQAIYKAIDEHVEPNSTADDLDLAQDSIEEEF